MPDDADELDDDALGELIDELLQRKPHLAARRARGSFGQGEPDADDAVSLAGILRANA